MGDEGKDWFDGAGLGLFVHWTHSSAAGRELSWPLVGGTTVLAHSGECTVDEYYASVADALGGQGWHHWLLTELRVAVRDLHTLAAG